MAALALSAFVAGRILAWAERIVRLQLRVMRKALAGLAAVAVSLGATRASQPADFSGVWIASDAAPPNLARAPVATLGDRFAIRHSGNSLTVLRPLRNTVVASTFVLDGSEVRVTVPGGLCLGDSQTVETATREADTLVLSIVGSVPAGGGPVTKRDIRRAFRLADKETLVVESRMMVQGEPRPVATVYKRSAEPIVEAPAKPPTASASLAQIGWLAGTWSGSEKSVTVEERWLSASGGSMLALARQMNNGVMTSFEFLCIVERGGTLVYQAMPGGRSPATDFTLTSVTPDSATFENPAHDYPKVIRYAKLPDGSLQTTISAENGQRARTVVLKRQPPQ